MSESAVILCTNSEWFALHHILPGVSTIFRPLDRFILNHRLGLLLPQQAFEAEIRMQRTALQRQALALKEVSLWSKYMSMGLAYANVQTNACLCSLKG